MKTSLLQSPRKFRVSQIVLLGFSSLAAMAVLWLAAYWAHIWARNEIQTRSQNTLHLIEMTIRGELAKYQYKPQILAANPIIHSAFENPNNKDLLAQVNRELEYVTKASGALDTYLMMPDGSTIAASNWSSEKTFIGQNFSYRPYFQEALQGSLGEYFAVGTTSGERGYFYAYPVQKHGSILGVVIVKIKLQHLEAQWRSSDQEIVIADNEGVIFLSSNPLWLYHSLTPLTAETRARLRMNRKYADHIVKLIPIANNLIEPENKSLSLLNWLILPFSPTKDFLTEKINMKNQGWDIILLARTSHISKQVWLAVTIAGFMLVSMILAARNIYLKRQHLTERIALQIYATEELEKRVDERTRELNKTQSDLVQATKLAALGQMSAGISHELNQPLAAIRSYADNAREFLDRDQFATVKQNLSGISELTDRMARIIKNLRTYARKETIETHAIMLSHSIEEALELLAPMLRKHAIEIIKTLPDEDILVVAGSVRLQQVFVNLISNSIDAVENALQKRIYLRAYADQNIVLIEIQDSGPGIAEESMQNVFDPFYSTKAVGKGMGLGLSITYGIIKQFGGKIEAGNAPEGGALFRIQLSRAKENILTGKNKI